MHTPSVRHTATPPTQGKVSNLEGATAAIPLDATLGIAHTRWATHGAPNDVNAHPHVSSDGSIAVVHNGIIENFSALRKALQAEGYKFTSETDTELFAHLVADTRAKHRGMPLDAVVRLALQPVEGAFGVAFIFADQPNLLIGARRGSPLLVGVGENEFFLASDASAIVVSGQRRVGASGWLCSWTWRVLYMMQAAGQGGPCWST
jgi:glucosamine--fructose-6-phosphate aminotransferase (isomerizing)